MTGCTMLSTFILYILLDILAVVEISHCFSELPPWCYDYGDNCYVETLGLLLGARAPANLLPIFPKHTQLQKSTLAIQIPTPMLSLLIRP